MRKDNLLQSIWHPATEEPSNGRLCLGNYDSSSLIATTFGRDNVGDWATYARLSAIKRWAYIDDLIPSE